MALAVAVVNRSDYGCFNARLTGNGRFYFAQFNAVAPYFNLRIVSADEFHFTGICPAGKIAGAIQASQGAVCSKPIGVFQKSLGVNVRSIPITPGHLGTTNIHLTHHAGRHRLFVGIQYIDLGVVDGCADGNRGFAAISFHHPVTGGEHSGFSGAVVVDKNLWRAVA